MRCVRKFDKLSAVYTKMAKENTQKNMKHLEKRSGLRLKAMLKLVSFDWRSQKQLGGNSCSSWLRLAWQESIGWGPWSHFAQKRCPFGQAKSAKSSPSSQKHAPSRVAGTGATSSCERIKQTSNVYQPVFTGVWRSPHNQVHGNLQCEDHHESEIPAI